MITRAQQQFMDWLENYDAALFSVASTHLKAQNRQTLGAAEIMGPPAPSFFDRMSSMLESGFNTITATAEKLIPQYQAYKAKSAVVKTQIRRAKQGLPPLATPLANPTPLLPEEIQRLRRSAERQGVAISRPTPQYVENLKVALPWIGGGLLLWTLTTKKKGR